MIMGKKEVHALLKKFGIELQLLFCFDAARLAVF